MNVKKDVLKLQDSPLEQLSIFSYSYTRAPNRCSKTKYTTTKHEFWRVQNRAFFRAPPPIRDSPASAGLGASQRKIAILARSQRIFLREINTHKQVTAHRGAGRSAAPTHGNSGLRARDLYAAPPRILCSRPHANASSTRRAGGGAARIDEMLRN